MIAYTPRAARQVKDLRQYYEDLNRIEAVVRLMAALDRAEANIERNPLAGLAAPRPYPQLVRSGMAWIHAGRYWISYSLNVPPVITGVFYDAADIPNRL